MRSLLLSELDSLHSVLSRIGLYHSTEIGRILSGLVDTKMLLANKKGSWTDYRLNEDYEIRSEQVYYLETGLPQLALKNETDLIIYEYAKVNKFITTAQVIQITKTSTRQGASLALHRLISKGLLRPSGKGKSTIYECVE